MVRVGPPSRQAHRPERRRQPLARRVPPVAAVSLRLALAAVAIVALAGACGGDGRRDAVATYIEETNAIQRELLVPLGAARHVYTELSRAEADLADVRQRVIKAARAIETLERRLAQLEPPPDAKRLHALLLQLVEAQVRLAQEVERLTDFVPRFEQRLGPLRDAERRLRKALADARTADSQAAAIGRYGRDVGTVLRTIRPLEPPAPMAASYETQVDTLEKVRDGAEALAEALRRDDVDVLPARILQLANAARASQSLAAQRANIAALKLYNRRISRVGELAGEVNLERARLQRTLR